MRVALSLAALGLPGLVSCADQAPPGERSDADTDADSDSDSDTDVSDAGDDIASAVPIAYSDGTEPSASDAIGTAGDRDVFGLDMAFGDTIMAFTAAYAVDGEVQNPDTVIRVLDASGQLLVENDDMPTDLQATDSAVWFQAPATATYYLEVLEWSDLDPRSGGAAGGADWYYDLWAVPLTIADVEPNDATADVDEMWDAGEADLWANFFGANYATDFYGITGSADDVDMWRIDLEEPEFLAILLYPAYWPSSELELTMYDETSNVVAWTDSPEFDAENRIAYEDAALLHWAQPGTYYFSVTDANGTVGTTYAGMIVLYLESSSQFETENNDVVFAGNPVTFGPWKSFLGFSYFGTMTGNVSTSGDTVDCFTVSASDVGGTLDGMYLAARTQAMTAGTLVDTEITIYQDDDGTTVLANETDSDLTGSPDAGVTDLELPDDQTSVHVCVEAESADPYAPANQYMLAFQVSPQPMFE